MVGLEKKMAEEKAEEKKVKVLLADDEQHVRQLIKAVLTPLGSEIVAEAQNGNEALARYKELRPDVVLLDVNMPVKDGIAALREIREFDGNASVIMLTSLSDMETIQTALELGAIQYIRKDTPITEMRQIIKDAWQHLGVQRL
ncbi:MAG: response regulator [Acidobacteriota bacterium]|nr:response regulator [Acidobacteriota bacterium]